MSEETSWSLCIGAASIALTVCVFFWSGCEQQNKITRAALVRDAVAKGCSVVGDQVVTVICPERAK